MKTKKLTKKEVTIQLSSIIEWKLVEKGTKLSRTFLFPDFKTALRFVNKVGKEAELVEHHPDIMLSYGKVKIILSTHDAGGLTQMDFDLAGTIDGQFDK